MLRNNVFSTLTFFYPFGNTPAVCLTQDLPPEQDADILLLGCGDARNILFTTFAQLARNILLSTLIVDDDSNRNISTIWDIYYHVRVGQEAIDLLDIQAVKLSKFARSIESWNASQYGKLIRFCDHRTLVKVERVWTGYIVTDLSKQERQARTETLKAAVDRAQTTKKSYMSDDITMSCVRSAGPAGVYSLKDVPQLAKQYWKYGTLYNYENQSSTALHPNPALLSAGDRYPTLHYGSNPLLEFHLATAYVPLHQSHLQPEKQSAETPLVVVTAQAEFSAWATSFRATADRLIVRVFTGDALAFSHTLQRLKNNHRIDTAELYCDSWTFDVLRLDGGDYVSTSSHRAPVAFNLIDTSNLVDHLGPLNILVATAPLLVNQVSSTLYTEILVQHESDVQDMLENLLCGHFDTVSLLLGLANVESWTNVTASVDSDEAMVTLAMQSTSGLQKDANQVRTRISWKLASTLARQTLHTDPKGFARLIHEMYRKMFLHEDPASLMASMSTSGPKKSSNPYYTRASYAILLEYLQSVVTTDWKLVMEYLYEILNAEGALSIGANYLQELSLYLHEMNLYRVRALESHPQQIFGRTVQGRLSKWTRLPPIMTITLVVPLETLSFLQRLGPGKTGIPSLRCSLQSAKSSQNPWLNFFGAIQACFGNVLPSTDKHTGDLSISVTEDMDGLQGRSPLIVSFHVPTWILLQDEDNTVVEFGFQHIPHTIAIFLSQLGPNLSIFSTTLKNTTAVLLTTKSPFLSKNMEINSTLRSDATQDASNHIDLQTQTFSLDPKSGQINTLACKLQLKGEALVALADKATKIETRQDTPTEVAVSIGQNLAVTASFARPVSGTFSKLRIARKSGYIEVVAPLSTLTSEVMQTFLFPSSLMVTKTAGIIPVCWNMPVLNIDTMPRFDFKQKSKLQWLTPHVSMMLSTRERALRDANMGSSSNGDLRVDLKDGLFSLLMHSSGLQGQKASIFGLNREGDGGFHVVICVSALRLDLATRSVVVDAAVIPLEHSIIQDPLWHKCFTRIQRVAPPAGIQVSSQELRAWKMMLPAFAERCRTWSHAVETCEYVKAGSVPVPSGFENAKTPLCSCGRGHVPTGFMRDLDVPGLAQILKKYATRIAIPLFFAVPYVEKCFSLPAQGPVTKVNTNVPGKSLQDSANGGCAMCGRDRAQSASHEDPKALLKCGRCREVKYCSADCQKKHWKMHKLVCVQT